MLVHPHTQRQQRKILSNSLREQITQMFHKLYQSIYETDVILTPKPKNSQRRNFGPIKLRNVDTKNLN